MIMRAFILAVLMRIAVLFGLLIGLATVILNPEYLFTQLILGAVMVAWLFEFFRYVTKTNRDLSKFLFAIRHRDFSISFQDDHMGSAFKDLHASFRSLIQAYRDLQLEKEGQFQILMTLVDQLPVGLMVVREGGEVDVMNQAAERMLSLPRILHMSRITTLRPSLETQLRTLTQDAPLPIEIDTPEGTNRCLVQVTEMTPSDTADVHRVYIFQDIAQAQDEAEMDAWLKLIRILTHEIMNSVTSVSSLSATAIDLLEKPARADGLKQALNAIHQRSSTMLDFVEDYRQLTNVPAPRLAWFPLKDCLSAQVEALRPVMEKEGIEIHIEASGKLKVHADETQIAQVISNILLNAIQALSGMENAQITSRIEKQGSETRLHIANNGVGIPPEDLKDIFTPFFTTRKDGSGIGLSLARQIMRYHRGSIAVQSSKESTAFTILFRER